MRRLHLLALVALSVVGALVSAASASAAPTDPFQYKFSFDAGGLLSEPKYIAVNVQTGVVLISNAGNIYQVDSAGNPVDFPATGSPQVPGNGFIAVDNGDGPTQGNFYVFEDEAFRAYHADGSPSGEGIWGPGYFQPAYEGSTEFSVCGGGLAPDGHVWVATSASKNLTELTATGIPTGRQEHVTTGPGPNGEEFIRELGCQIVFDDHGSAYITGAEGVIWRYDVDDHFAKLGRSGLLGTVNNLRHLATDPSTADVYLAVTEQTVNGPAGHLRAIPLTDPPVESTPTEVLPGIKYAEGVGLDGSGQTLYLSYKGKVTVFHREPPSPPRDLAPLQTSEVRSRGVVLDSDLIAGGAPTSYRFEYGTDTSYGSSTEAKQAPVDYFAVGITGALSGLQPNTTYHVRLAATNSAGTTYGADKTFTTYSTSPGGPDPCPNALARKQTSARALPDCRAYELVSAADTGGYDVESYLAPGQTPFPGFPLATDRVLYATHSGAVPGPWNATNKGPDPYVATRTANGWATDYKGLPADLNPAAGSFSSVLGEADSSLSTLAFAGLKLCSPCFTGGGLETGIPVRLPSGQLVQGMTGSLAGGVPASAKPEGKVAKYFSQDGQHLLFASKYAFEPGANTGGDLTVYDRNLSTGVTQIASTDQVGNPLTGTVSGLDISSDGSRILTAKQVSVDSAGNEYVHPYLHLGSSPNSVDLAPGTISGVLFAGMTADGSKAFFTSTDKLTGTDSDESADLYEAAVDGSGNLELSVITEPDSDACNPVSNSNGSHWNSTGAAANCGAVAIAGGGGVASASGAVYFLSPESLGGKGTLNQPNLYLAQSGGSPAFVATLEPDNPLVLDSVKANATRRTGDFQTTPSGNYAAFVSALPLSEADTFGFDAVFRYEAGSGEVACASCDASETDEASVRADATLPPHGLALLDDGGVFFTTRAQLVLNDPNGRGDVYFWSGGAPRLISAGSGPFDSGLLTVSADGTDVFFFTHDALAPEEDRNGILMKIYDAREGGGFFKLPPGVPCAASDECHGPGTVAPVAPDIRSSGKTTAGNVLVCPKNRVKRRGQCVKQRKAHAKKKHAKKRSAKKRNANTTGKQGGRHA